MRVGALEARRWAGLVFAAGLGEGIGLRLVFTTPDGRRRELEDWYWMVSRVGPHAPDGSYARMEFDLAVEPSSSSRPAESTLALEWSRREDAVALRAVAHAPGRLDLVGDAPWGWETRWEEGPDGWHAAFGGVEIVAAFGPLAEDRVATVVAWEPTEAPLRSAGAANPHRLASAADYACLGADNVAQSRARRLLPGLDRWIDDARADWDRRRPRSSGAAEGLVEAVTGNLMWTVLLQPETGRLYAPAGRRWIFPKPGDRASEASEPGDRARQEGAPEDSVHDGAPGSNAQEDRPAPDDWTVFGWGFLLQRPRARHGVETPGLERAPRRARVALPERERAQLEKPVRRDARPLPAAGRILRGAEAASHVPR